MTFQFENLADFWTMGGHGGYVWFCYAATLLVYGSLALATKQRLHRLKRQVQAIEAQAETVENRL